MTWYADGTPYVYWTQAPGLLSVGWLDGEHEFPRGEVPGPVLDRLAWLCVHDQQEQTRGLHACELCLADDTAWHHIVRDGERSHLLGSAQVWVVGEHTSHAAPDLVLHHIVDHGYLPPPDFIEHAAALPHALPSGTWSVQRALDACEARW